MFPPCEKRNEGHHNTNSPPPLTPHTHFFPFFAHLDPYPAVFHSIFFSPYLSLFFFHVYFCSCRTADLTHMFLLVWYYCTLTIRESILKVSSCWFLQTRKVFCSRHDLFSLNHCHQQLSHQGANYKSYLFASCLIDLILRELFFIFCGY